MKIYCLYIDIVLQPQDMRTVKQEISSPSVSHQEHSTGNLKLLKSEINAVSWGNIWGVGSRNGVRRITNQGPKDFQVFPAD